MAEGLSLLQQDAEARDAALDARQSLLLQAPAGSGKTTVLTARFLTLLATVDAPEEILAITFTRKAAAEMRQRILAALNAADDAVPSGLTLQLLQRARERDRQCGWQLRDNPGRLQVQTIDALNNRLARALPVSARAAPGLELARHPRELYRRAAQRALEAAWLEQDMRAAAELLFERLDNQWGRLQQLLSEMLSHRSHWLPQVLGASADGLVERVHASLRSLIGAELASARDAIPPFLRAEGEALLAHSMRGRVAGVPILGANVSELPYWRALCELALTGNGWRQRLTVREGFEAHEKALKQQASAWIASMAGASLEPTLRAVASLPDERLASGEELALRALAQLLMRAALELHVVFAETGRVDFTYVAGAARQSLTQEGQPSDLALRLGLSLRHILVDEFQDTSFEQAHLLQSLTAGWEQGDGRTLFLVGDPMQSIYQFRNAEVGLFLLARSHGIGALRLQPLALRRNFRTRAPLLQWINEHFAQLFPRRDDPRPAAIAYLPSFAAREGLPVAQLAPVGLHRLAPDDRQGEAHRVREIVEAARAQDPECSIAILVANRQHATRIAAVLRAAQLPIRGVDLEPLGDRAVVRDLAALTRALQHPADRTAWLGLLRAPWCGLTLPELECFAANAGTDHYAAIEKLVAEDDGSAWLDPDRRAALARLAQALRPAMRAAERALPLWQRVEHCWLRLAGPAVYCEAVERLDAQRFLDALALHEDPGLLLGEQLSAQMLDSLYSAAPPQPGAVEIMTMHAAKGLEWDVVILPGLGRSPAADSDPLLHWLELPRTDQDSELLIAPIRAGTKELPHSLGGYIKGLRRERRRLEHVRLLYVAATRARRQLHLLGALRESAHGEPRPAPKSPLQTLWPALQQEFAALPIVAPPMAGAGEIAQLRSAPGAPAVPGVLEVPASAPVPVPVPVPAEVRATAPLRRMTGSWRLPEPPAVSEPIRLSLPAGPASDTPEYRWVGLTSRAIGTIVHAELHRLSQLRPLPAARQLRASPAQYARWLADLGVAQEARAWAGQRILEALSRTLSDVRGRWLLSDAHREAHSEWRLTGLHDGRVVNVVFDRMLVDDQGHRWIVDFKTGSHEGGSPEEFLQAELERHAPQLRRYGRLASALGREPLRLALYFPLLGEFRELPLSSGAAAAP